MLYPKLLGTYEKELEFIIEHSISKRHDLIIDVGAADGYYAVGFAIRCPDSHIIAYEDDSLARHQLQNLANLNKVNGKLDIRGRCETSDLMNVTEKCGLIIIDCEGFEETLLSIPVINHLKGWDFIVETHDGLVPEVTCLLEKRFAQTHNTERIEVIHDMNKAEEIRLDVLNGLPHTSIVKLLAEQRQPACMRWLVCRPLEIA
jgi:hypothetical protein